MILDCPEGACAELFLLARVLETLADPVRIELTHPDLEFGAGANRTGLIAPLRAHLVILHVHNFQLRNQS